MNRSGSVITDHGNSIFDAWFQEVEADYELHIDAIPGVVANGLYFGMAQQALIAGTTQCYLLKTGGTRRSLGARPYPNQNKLREHSAGATRDVEDMKEMARYWFRLARIKSQAPTPSTMAAGLHDLKINVLMIVLGISPGGITSTCDN